MAPPRPAAVPFARISIRRLVIGSSVLAACCAWTVAADTPKPSAMMVNVLSIVLPPVEHRAGLDNTAGEGRRRSVHHHGRSQRRQRRLAAAVGLRQTGEDARVADLL